jgi:hypothetical protein
MANIANQANSFAEMKKKGGDHHRLKFQRKTMGPTKSEHNP